MDSTGNDAMKAADAETNKMGFLSCSSYVIGNIIGAGIFITPVSIVNEVGSVGLSLIIWIISGLIALIGSIVFIELGTSIVEPGCDFAYVCYVKWNAIAFAFMWVGVFITFPASIAVQAQTFGRYIVEGIAPFVNVTEPYDVVCSTALAFILLALIVWINFQSLEEFAAKFQIIVTIAKLGSMALVICAGFYLLIVEGKTSNLQNPFQNTNWSVGNIVFGLYAGAWSYAGWDVLNYGTPEIRKPEKTMPLSLIVGIAVVSLVYTLTNVSYFVVLSVDEVKNTTAIAATFSQRALGNFSYIVPFMVAILICGTLNSNIFCGSRLAYTLLLLLIVVFCMYAAAREGHLPAFLSCINHENGSPRAALLAQAIITAAMMFADSDKLIEYVSFVMFFQRIVTMIALLWIRYKKIAVHPGAIRVPIILTWLFLLISVALVAIPLVTNFVTTFVGILIVIAGVIFYTTVLKRDSIPSKVEKISGKLIATHF
ncbi:unnamed protein product [Anisakis simplex]|uniref:Solute carrier family 7 member 13 (inferred by orthology to a human protein) n=1 Tax=Anisakis simplex TaxID=6269 RepID=A0A0M3JUW7_ANISI|nr:unnamed protein product [Anisakis simplex]